MGVREKGSTIESQGGRGDQKLGDKRVLREVGPVLRTNLSEGERSRLLLLLLMML